jgi:hypothetical protein
VPRSYFDDKSSVKSLHVFVDASQQAYGAVAYLLDGQYFSFAMSKAGVSLLEGHVPQLTLSKLEVIAAIIGTSNYDDHRQLR